MRGNMLRVYPSPLATYEQVVADKDLFMSTLSNLHSQMGTKFWIPKVRFEDMDLHKVFCEVTSRGGIEQIVREQRWKDVFDTFNFPKSQRNPIFILHMRRLYYSLLHNYEIIYFFKARGLFPLLTGFVYGKNESGYLVTFTMGSWNLEGVLYESTENRVTQDLQRQSYDIFPNTLTDKANPQELFKTKRIQWDKAIKQKKIEIIIDALPLQQWLPKENTEADVLMQESEENEDEEYYSDSEVEDLSLWAEQTTHMEKASDLMVAVPVTGVLDGIFDSGYFVTVTIGSEKLQGVLYPQSPLLNTVTQEKLNAEEKAINKGMEVVEDKPPCSRENGRSQP
ncbi:PREDICTED: high mobility group B protein 15-like [Camelina sativa]|uniref:High mobility group B protein 15-like n=1 Tax=Camelina sativa TaxID=90675 RepID=A0ABM0SNT7_CAMSA|nr:PREDICTED: high mobility group B protein 15-like [Camelina sativa]